MFFFAENAPFLFKLSKFVDFPVLFIFPLSVIAEFIG